MDPAQSAQADDRLLADCPHCGKPPRFNPFWAEVETGVHYMDGSRRERYDPSCKSVAPSRATLDDLYREDGKAELVGGRIVPSCRRDSFRAGSPCESQ